jgi:glycosyltransferase involved in cell wall biosynthesis
MMAGVPVTVAENTAMAEIGGEAADTFDPYDIDDMSRSMERILTDRDVHDRLTTIGLEHAKRYSWRKAAEATLAVCDSVRLQ